MTDAPKRIWAELDGDDIIFHNNAPDLKALISTGYLHQYHRADLSAELVRAALEAAAEWLDDIGEEPAADELRATEAIAAIVARVTEGKP